MFNACLKAFSLRPESEKGPSKKHSPRNVHEAAAAHTEFNSLYSTQGVPATDSTVKYRDRNMFLAAKKASDELGERKRAKENSRDKRKCS